MSQNLYSCKLRYLFTHHLHNHMDIFVDENSVEEILPLAQKLQIFFGFLEAALQVVLGLVALFAQASQQVTEHRAAAFARREQAEREDRAAAVVRGEALEEVGLGGDHGDFVRFPDLPDVGCAVAFPVFFVVDDDFGDGHNFLLREEIREFLLADVAVFPAFAALARAGGHDGDAADVVFAQMEKERVDGGFAHAGGTAERENVARKFVNGLRFADVCCDFVRDVVDAEFFCGDVREAHAGTDRGADRRDARDGCHHLLMIVEFDERDRAWSVIEGRGRVRECCEGEDRAALHFLLLEALSAGGDGGGGGHEEGRRAAG